VPLVEITGDADYLGRRSPDGKADARDAFACSRMCAERAIAFVIRPFAVKVKFEGREQRRGAVRGLKNLNFACVGRWGGAVLANIGDRGDEEAFRMKAQHRDYKLSGDDPCLARLREPGANLPIMRSEDRERVAVAAIGDSGDLSFQIRRFRVEGL